MTRPAPALLFLLLAQAASACRAPAGTLAGRRVIDLTHAFDEQTIYWPTAGGFELRVDSKGWTEGGFYYEANSFSSAEHGGTHIDAPIHFAEGRRSLDQIPLEQLIGPGVVVDVSAACARDRDHLVSAQELQAWEREHGRIPDGAIVLLRTGFGEHWPDRERYMGTDERGPEAVSKLHFPGLHPDAARWLVAHRVIGAIGLDTPSIDHGPSRTFEAHQVLFAADVPALENVANLELLPARGFEVVALPMKIRAGSGGPVRIAALLGGECVLAAARAMHAREAVGQDAATQVAPQLPAHAPRQGPRSSHRHRRGPGRSPGAPTGHGARRRARASGGGTRAAMPTGPWGGLALRAPRKEDRRQPCGWQSPWAQDGARVPPGP